MGSIVSIIISLISVGAAGVAFFQARRAERRAAQCELQLQNTKETLRKLQENSIAERRLKQQVIVSRETSERAGRDRRQPGGSAMRYSKNSRPRPHVSPARVVAQRLLARGQTPEIVSQKVMLPVTEIMVLQAITIPPLNMADRAEPSEAILPMVTIGKDSASASVFYRDQALL